MWVYYGWTIELCGSVEKRKRKQQCETQETLHMYLMLCVKKEKKKTMGDIRKSKAKNF